MNFISSGVIDIPAFFGKKAKYRLVFENEGLTIKKPFSFEPSVFIPREEIMAFRMGVNRLYGYSFIFGRQYVIELQNAKQKSVYRLKLNSLYGFKRHAYYRAWTEVFKQLWNYYFDDLLNCYLELYRINQVFELIGVKIEPDGISWENSGKLRWNEILLCNYKTYFVIRDIRNIKQYKSFNFLNDWNAYVLQSLIRTIMEQHKYSPYPYA